MQSAYRRCCGIDVHKKSVMVHVLPPQGQPGGKALEREFRTFTRDLRSLRGWLKHCRVTEAVMESTGQYGRAVWNILEGEVPQLILVNPTHVKALAGQSTFGPVLGEPGTGWQFCSAAGNSGVARSDAAK